MGANEFYTRANGKTAAEAFRNAKDSAYYDYGHRGYTGSLAEKGSFVELAVPDGIEPSAYARDLMDNGDDRIDDKWGPAGCVKLTDGQWLFFGWASS